MYARVPQTLLAILAAFLVVGCVDGGATVESGPASASTGRTPAATSAAQPTTTEDTGSIAVTVITTEFEPVAAASVVLDGTELTGYTDDVGRATFNGLTPGKYTVLAAKPGYRPSHDRGVLIDVAAGAVAEAKVILDPIPIVDAEHAYHETFHFIGIIACSFNGTQGTVGYTSYCSRGVTVAGQPILNPRDNGSHPWEVDSILVQSIVNEAVWQQSNALNSRELLIGTYTSKSCTNPGSLNVATTCNPSNGILEKDGASPIYTAKHEGGDLNITKKRLGDDPKKYPAKVYTEVRAYCRTCTGFALVIEQRYDAWASAFYGAEAPPDFRARPPG